MFSSLPRWVLVGGGVLAFIAGIVNATGFLGIEHQAVTHLTGTTTLLGIAVASGDEPGTLHLLAVIGSFLAGAALSGAIIQNSALKLGRRYGVVLLIESLLLFASVALLQRGIARGDLLASGAMGLQNAMASSYSGAVLRTTHVSGIFTDIGIAIGHMIRRLPIDFRRLRLLCLLASSFFGGSAAGSVLFQYFRYGALYFPAILTGVTGIGYALYRHYRLSSTT
jgi:uncharacterized membrane protein YoaK (UPF0700 family)